MQTSPNNSLPSFRIIREAIIGSPPRPQGFPLSELHNPKKLKALRSTPHLQQFLTDMRAEAVRAQSTPLLPLPFNSFQLFETTGDRTTYEHPYFDRRRRLLGLTLATVIDEVDDYLPTLADLIWEICNEYTWALPAHIPVGITAVKEYRLPPEQVIDLFAAHTAHALAEVITLLGGRLNPWLHYRVRTEVERRTFQPLFHDPRHFGWESVPMNWSAVCAGCAGMAALVLEDDRERLAGMIDRVIRAMECFLEGFGDDGGCPEGIGYWNYGFGFYTYFADMLAMFTEGRLDLFQSERVRRIVAFPQAISLGKGAYINYSDADKHATIHPGFASHLIARFKETIPGLKVPNFHSDHCYRWGNATYDLLRTNPSLLDMPVSDGSFYLPDLAWVVDRHIINDVTLAFSAKGGHNDEPHNHNDLGNFILHLGGESLLADLGAGVYTRQYFGAQRYEELHTGSQGHSVPFINGQAQSAGREYAATVLGYEPQPDGVKFALDLTRAYAKSNLESFIRTFAWSVDLASHSAKLLLTDAFRFTASTIAFEEYFISLRSPTLGADTVTWSNSKGSITMNFDRTQFEPLVESIATYAHLGEPLTVYRLRLRALEAIVEREFSFVFACQLLQ